MTMQSTGRDYSGRSGRSPDESMFNERVVRISRVSKVVKGGRHLSFNAVVVVGDGDGQVGVGMGKADAVPDAVRKGATNARKNMITVPLSQTTIPHEITSVYGSSLVMMRPAPQGTGVIAGGAVRAVVELAGIKDIVTKIRRSTNPVNSAKAALKGLETLQDPERALMRRRQVARTASAEAARSCILARISVTML